MEIPPTPTLILTQRTTTAAMKQGTTDGGERGRSRTKDEQLEVAHKGGHCSTNLGRKRIGQVGPIDLSLICDSHICDKSLSFAYATHMQQRPPPVQQQPFLPRPSSVKSISLPLFTPLFCPHLLFLGYELGNIRTNTSHTSYGVCIF